MGPDSRDSIDNDDHEEELLAAAASAWAASNSTDEKEGKSSRKRNRQPPLAATSPTKSENNNSLHITQLSFDCTKMDLQQLFLSKNCPVKSIRMVYDNHREEKTFRGVAFCDLYTQESCLRAMRELHHTTFQGRKINVRPTKSKQEMKDIVERTKELVAQKIEHEKERRNAQDPLETKKKENKQDGRKVSRTNSPSKQKGEHKQKPKKRESNHKLTKKERNRRAAIIMQQRKKKKG